LAPRSLSSSPPTRSRRITARSRTTRRRTPSKTR
jgi:hypothetical protein